MFFFLSLSFALQGHRSSMTKVPEQRRVMTLLSELCLLSAIAVLVDVAKQSARGGACGPTSVWR